ncbi:MAG: type I glyceraldehyde-3-phosphate dehydrogenase [Flavobacteriales bacterium]
MVNVSINGAGRIGRLTLRDWLERDPGDPLRDQLNIVAINDLIDIPTLAYLLEFDSVHGRFKRKLSYDDEALIIGDEGLRIPVYSEEEPEELPWQEEGVKAVIESTGVFRKKEEASRHIKAGASKVVISAPAKGEVPTYVLGVNDKTLDKDDTVISNASCTTNCLAPMVKLLDDNWGVESGFMNTVHAYTADQNLQDGPHSKDLGRARAAGVNIVPTSTGAADAIGHIMPHLEGRLEGMAMRVPVVDGSITDLTVTLEEMPTVQGVNELLKDASQGPMKGILDYSEKNLVSSDIVGDPHSCIIDGSRTRMIDRTVKLVAWYDNEAAYSRRLLELTRRFTQ